jgi:hypothetical protein
MHWFDRYPGLQRNQLPLLLDMQYPFLFSSVEAGIAPGGDV